MLSAKTRSTSAWETASPPSTPASWSVTSAIVVKHIASSRASEASGMPVIPTTVQPACLVPARLGPRREARAVDDHQRAGRDGRSAGGLGGAQDGGPAARAVGVGEPGVDDGPSPSKTVWSRPHVRSTTWSGTTTVPGPWAGTSEPTAQGASTCRTPTARRAQRLAR